MRTKAKQAEAHLRHYVKTGRYLPPETEVVLTPYKEPLTPVEEGFGYMGALAHSTEGTHVQCHICGYLFTNLGRHVATTHDISSDEYRTQFGLSKGTSLISKRYATVKAGISIHRTPEQKQRMLDGLKKSRALQATRSTYPKESLESKNKKGLCPDQILDKIEALGKKLGRTPTRREFIQEYTETAIVALYRTYGTWNQALSFAGFTPNSYRQGQPRYSRESVIGMIRTAYEIEGRVPRARDYGVLLPSKAVIYRLFGGLIEARRAAGFGQADYVSEMEDM